MNPTFLITLALLLLAAAPFFIVPQLRARQGEFFANMEQGSITTPNLASFNRLTGKAVFTPTGQVSGIHLGNIEMIKQSLNEKTNDIFYAIDGNTVLATRELTNVAPIWTINGNQFHTPLNPFLLLGSQNTDVTQASGVGSTLSITVALGKTFDIGARNIVLTSVKDAGDVTTFVDGVDYFAEAKDGLIRFPVVAAGIANGVVVHLVYTKPLLVRESYTAFNSLNTTGTLVVFEKDNKDPVAMNEFVMVGTIYVKSMGDTDALKHKKWEIDFALNGQPTVYRRKN